MRRPATKTAIPAAPALAALLAALVLPAARAATPGEARPEAVLERSSAELAASLSIARLREALAAAAPDDAPLFAEMAASPARYADKTGAETALRPVFANAFAARFASEASAILERLSSQRGDGGFTFSPAFADAATNVAPAFLEGYVASNYPGAFAAARDRACRDQASRLAARVRPTAEEVDSLPRKKLTATLVERIAAAQSEPVFEENLKFIETSFADPLVEEALRQRKAQVTLARTCAPSGYAPSAIAADIRKRLSDAIDGQRRDSAAPESIYGIFPSVAAKTIPECATNRATAILAQALDATPVPLDNDAMALAIAQDIDAHRTFDQSRRHFMPGLAAVMAASAGRAVAEAVPAGERDEAAAFAKAYLESKAVDDRLSARVKVELDASLKTLRDAFASVQFERAFPDLEDGRWLPGEPLVDAVAESNDFRKALSRWRERAEFGDFKSIEASSRFLEETSGILDARIVTRFEPGVAAMTAQHRIADALFDAVKGEFAEGGFPSLDKVVGRYRDAVAARWREERPGTLGDAMAEGGAYSALFPSTVRKIELLARAMMEAPVPEEAAPEETPPEEPPQTPPELPEAALECRIVYSRHRDEIVAEVMIGEAAAGRFTCPYAPKGFRQGALAFAERTAGAVEEIVRRETGHSRLALTVVIDVQDPLVYHGAVADAAWLLKKTMGDLGESITSFDIQVER